MMNKKNLAMVGILALVLIFLIYFYTQNSYPPSQKGAILRVEIRNEGEECTDKVKWEVQRDCQGGFLNVKCIDDQGLTIANGGTKRAVCTTQDVSPEGRYCAKVTWCSKVGEFQPAEETVEDLQREVVTCTDCYECQEAINRRENSGKTIRLTEDIPGFNAHRCIDWDNNDVIFDCAGHEIKGKNSHYGIFMVSQYGNAIKNCRINRFQYGIYIRSSHSNSITGNEINSNRDGIFILYSWENNITGNRINSNQRDGIFMNGSLRDRKTGNRIRNNEVNSNRGHGVIVYSSSGDEITDNAVCYNSFGDIVVADDSSLTMDSYPCGITGFRISGSGIGDGYCDRAGDGRCDPDCTPKGDPDCEVTTSTLQASPENILPELDERDYYNYALYLLGLFVVIAIALIIKQRREQARKARREREEENELREWIKTQIRDGEDPELLRKALEREGSDPAIVDEIMKRL